MAIDPAALRAVLDDVLLADRFAGTGDPAGVWHAGEGPVRAVGFALEPWDGLPGWAGAERLDALVLHRPWNLRPSALPGIDVVAYHLAFDERLTVGMNPWLAAAVGIAEPEPLGRKAGRPLGMVGRVVETTGNEIAARFAAELGSDVDVRVEPDGPIDRVAVVGAMWPELVREARERGAQLYVTGTWRERARPAIHETGIGVLVVGHAAPERWGMRALARLVADRLPGVRCVLAPGLAPARTGSGADSASG